MASPAPHDCSSCCVDLGNSQREAPADGAANTNYVGAYDSCKTARGIYILLCSYWVRSKAELVGEAYGFRLAGIIKAPSAQSGFKQ